MRVGTQKILVEDITHPELMAAAQQLRHRPCT
jgi:hypothetical protein